MKYAIVTFGCRVNQAESLGLEGALRQRGAEPAAVDAADLVVVNTCTVTASADQGARQTIRHIARHNPAARIVVTGCYATREPLAVAPLPGVLRVVPNQAKLDLVDRLALELDGATAERIGGGEGPCGTPIVPGAAGRTAYTLCVQTGCDERCAYCVIPSTRGRSRSVAIPDVLGAARRAVQAGFREIAVTGVHLGSWGRDLAPRQSLLDLLRALADADLDARFRISSLEPMDCPPDLVDLVARAGRFAPHFHLPLQHASDRMLALMRRPYTLGAYRRIVDLIRERLPHAAIGTDVIAGFPGETDEDFAQNEAYLPMSPLTSLHVFPYSGRPGTAATRLRGQVPGPVARARADRLRTVGTLLADRFRRAHIGQVRSGLTLEDGSLVVTDNYLKVRIAPGLPRNTRVDVVIEKIDTDLFGRIIGRS